MIALIVSWALSAAALLLSARVFSGVSLKGDFADALWIAAIYAVLSFLLSWFIFGVLGVVTLGLGFIFQFITRLVTAAIVVKVTAAMSSRFDVTGFAPALGTAVLLALAGEIGARLLAL